MRRVGRVVALDQRNVVLAGLSRVSMNGVRTKYVLGRRGTVHNGVAFVLTAPSDLTLRVSTGRDL